MAQIVKRFSIICFSSLGLFFSASFDVLADDSYSENSNKEYLITQTQTSVIEPELTTLPKLTNTIAIYNQWSDLSDFSSNWNYTSLMYGHKFQQGSVTAYINQARRYNQSATQYEIDAYPKISKGLYGYLDYAQSSDSLFPKHRYGAEAFYSLPASYEASLGGRYMQYENSIARVITGSVGKYKGNYWFSLRPYISLKKKGIGQSYYVIARRYFDVSDKYISLMVGTGSSPDASEQNPEEIDAIRSTSAQISMKYPLSKSWSVNGKAEYSVQGFPNNKVRRQIDLGLGLAFKF